MLGKRLALEGCAVLALVASIISAALEPLPLQRIPPPTIDYRVYPTTPEYEAHHARIAAPDGTILTVESIPPAGCLRIVSSRGAAPIRVCNARMSCGQLPHDRGATELEVYRWPAREGAFLATTGSQCDSSCCDQAAVLFTGSGERLRDGPVDRVLWRVGRSSILLAVVAVVAVAVAALGTVAASRRGLSALDAVRTAAVAATFVMCATLSTPTALRAATWLMPVGSDGATTPVPDPGPP